MTRRLQEVLPLCDLVVGTEEELRIAGGAEEPIEAIRNVRRLTDAVIVCKRGPIGAALFEGPIPGDIEEGAQAPGFPVEVFNVLGAGDGFMAGLLRGWLRGESWETALRYANACGALAVSRHGCAPSYPSWTELEHFLRHGSTERALRKDRRLSHIHHATTRWRSWPTVRALAFDGEFPVGTARRAGAFQDLCLAALKSVAGDGRECGVVVDAQAGRSALYAAAGSGFWIGRPFAASESPSGAGPERVDFGSELVEWPREHVVMTRLAPRGVEEPEWEAEAARLLRLQDAARRAGLELLVEIRPEDGFPTADGTVGAIERLYDDGLAPDWWLATAERGWGRVCDAAAAGDPHGRGVLAALRGATVEAAAAAGAHGGGRARRARLRRRRGGDPRRGRALVQGRAGRRGGARGDRRPVRRDRRGVEFATGRRDRRRGMNDLVRKPGPPDSDGLVLRVGPDRPDWEFVGFDLYRRPAGRGRARAHGGDRGDAGVRRGAGPRDGRRRRLRRDRRQARRLHAGAAVGAVPAARPGLVRGGGDRPRSRGLPGARGGPIRAAARAARRRVAGAARPRGERAPCAPDHDGGPRLGGAVARGRGVHARRALVLVPAPTSTTRTRSRRRPASRRRTTTGSRPGRVSGSQRVYTDDRSLDETIAVSDGDVVLVPRGYHPCAAPYGHEMYYLNVMAGPMRRWRFRNDPDFEWLFQRDAALG